jgi:hypothetical protein
MLTKTLTTALSVADPENETSVLAGVSVMELAGLEPATSWVRSVRERSRPVAPVR